jgi:hypothetical protein
MNPTIEVMHPAFTSGDGYFYQSKDHPFVHITAYFDADKPVLPQYKGYFKPGQTYLIETVYKENRKQGLAGVRGMVKDGTLHLCHSKPRPLVVTNRGIKT